LFENREVASQFLIQNADECRLLAEEGASSQQQEKQRLGHESPEYQRFAALKL
jgi:hypothetical protein